MNHAHQSPRYQIVENGRKTCDLLALNDDGAILHKLEDVSVHPDHAKRVAALYTENKLPLYQFEEVTTHLIGALL